MPSLTVLARTLIACLMSVVGPATAAADSGVLEAPQALAEASAGRLTLIDIRTPAEWQETGVAAGARAIDFLQPAGEAAFVAAVSRAVGGDLTAPVGVICRSGNRSARARGVLEAHGFRQVFDVSEGMGGGRRGPGWLRRGLPVSRWQPE